MLICQVEFLFNCTLGQKSDSDIDQWLITLAQMQISYALDTCQMSLLFLNLCIKQLWCELESHIAYMAA